MKQGNKTNLTAYYSADAYLRKIRQLNIPIAEKSIIASTLWLDCFSDCPAEDHISSFDEFLTCPVHNYDHETVVQGFIELGFRRDVIERRLLSEAARSSLSKKTHGEKISIFSQLQELLQSV